MKTLHLLLSALLLLVCPACHGQTASPTVTRPAVPYPRASIEFGEEGRVVLKVLVSSAGLPMDVVVASSSGFPRLDNAALAAARKWSFTPATKDGEKIEAWHTLPFEFRISD